jgi:hypothetical protein
MDYQEASDRYGPKAPWPITRERWWEMLECLPPCAWVRGSGSESFYVSELLSGDIAAHFVRIGDRYFELQASYRTPHASKVEMCRRLMQQGEVQA